MVLKSGEDWTQQTYLSLGGVYKNNRNRLPIALEKYLSEHGEPQEIILRLDHDEVGRNATKDILSGLKNANAKTVFCEKGKDYNEFLMMQKGLFLRKGHAEKKWTGSTQRICRAFASIAFDGKMAAW